MLQLVGSIFLGLGLLTGVALIFGPLGLWATYSGFAPSILFTVLVGAGYLLLALPSRLATQPVVSRVTGAILVLLAAGAALGLVLVTTSVVTASGGALQLWWVLAVGGVFGTAALLAHRPVSSA